MSRSPTGTAERWAPPAVLLAGVCFGGTFVVVQGALQQVGAVAFIALRFVLASVALWPLARRAPVSPGVWRDGLVPGATLLVGYLLQTLGLRSVPSSVSAFITELLVVMVPLGSVLLLRRLPARRALVGAALAAGGLWLLTGADVGFGWGEVETLGCAGAFAANILLLERVAGRHHPARLTLVQLVVVALGALGLSALTGGWHLDGRVLGAAAVTAVLASALAFSLQSFGQRHLDATRVSLLLMAEPVTAGAVGALTGVHLKVLGWAGAVLIVVGIGCSERWWRLLRPASALTSPQGAGKLDR